MRPGLRQWLFHSAIFASLLGVGGLLVALSGILPITASSGHWAATAAFLELAKKRAVWTHTLALEPPALDAPWLVLQGAGHYETGCRPCHGSPGERAPVIARSMTPHPPSLAARVPSWEPEELFYIVKHGIKFTGMPAWPALGRDDEVRAMVAFLRELPKLDARRYDQLVHGDAMARVLRPPLEDLHEPAPTAVVTSCARCHGEDGLGRGNAAFPKLAGQNRDYLYNALQAYAEGRRHSGMMQPVAAALDPQGWSELASYYAKLPAHDVAVPQPAESVERGRRIATRGIPVQGLPSCAECHGPTASERNPAYPLLAGQYAEYLVGQLELFKRQGRGGSSYQHIMVNVASRLKTEQMRDVARYYASLSPAPRAR